MLRIMQIIIYHVIGATSGTNIAVYKSADQSSNFDNGKYPADFAVDGYEHSNIHALSCMCTLQEQNPWWTLDLAAEERIQKVDLIFERF